MISAWRWLVLVLVFAAALWSHGAHAADDGLVLDAGTLAAIGTGAATLLSAFVGALWRFWPRGSGPTYTPPAESAPTVPPQPAPAPERIPTKSVLIRQIKGDEALQRFGELLPKLERLDWDALDDLGPRLDRDHDAIKGAIERLELLLKRDRSTD